MPKQSNNPKTAALRRHSSLNPHPEKVRDELFLSNAFFDPCDIVQVKYEMLRRVLYFTLFREKRVRFFGLNCC